jgi:hypothetical protein
MKHLEIPACCRKVIDFAKPCRAPPVVRNYIVNGTKKWITGGMCLGMISLMIQL